MKIKETFIPYIEAMKELVDEANGKQITSDEIERVVMNVNSSRPREHGDLDYLTGTQVINGMAFHNLLSIQSHLGQPRHGQPINGGRLHKIQVLRSQGRP